MAKAKKMKTKSVSFNIADPYQKYLFDYCEEQTNFSGFIKRLIADDLREEKNEPSKQHRPTEKKTAAERKPSIPSEPIRVKPKIIKKDDKPKLDGFI